MRCFLGFEPDPQTKLAIQAWREKALGHFEKAVPTSNYHVTSVFLGQCQNSQLDRLCSLIDLEEYSAFSLQFNLLGYWPKPKVLYLGCQQVPEQIHKLASSVSGIASRCQISLADRQYIPHITLVRNNKSNPPAPLFPPDISCHFDHLHLYESVSAKSGVQYPIRKSWPLRPVFIR